MRSYGWKKAAMMACALGAISSANGAIISVNGISGGNPGDVVAIAGLTWNGQTVSALADGYTSTGNASPSTFSQEMLAQTGASGTATSLAFTFSSIPVVSVGLLNELHFALIFNAAETGGNGSPPPLQISLSSIRITVNGSTVAWQSTDTIALNDNPLFETTGPRGNNEPDMALLIPVRVFNGLGLTGASQFTLTVTWADASNGADQWERNDRGLTSTPTFFGTNDPIQWTGVPEPGSLTLAAGALALATVRWIRRK